MIEPRVSLITLGVADLDRAKSFYENVIGWVAAPSPPEVAFFDLGGVIISLFPNSELAKDYGGEATPNSYQGFALAHNVRSVAEVDAIFAKLKAKGANIVKEPEQVFWGGYSGYFADPDGHLWEIAFNPFWTILDDGRISMEPPAV